MVKKIRAYDTPNWVSPKKKRPGTKKENATMSYKYPYKWPKEICVYKLFIFSPLFVSGEQKTPTSNCTKMCGIVQGELVFIHCKC